MRALHRLYLLFSLLFFGYFISHSQPESHREDLSVFVITQFDYSYVEVCIHGCVELSLAVSLALSLALSLPLSLSPFPKYACSACPLHSRFRSLSLAIPSTLPPDSMINGGRFYVHMSQLSCQLSISLKVRFKFECKIGRASCRERV